MAALITIEVHARDVIEHLHHVSAHGVGDFEWTRQLRMYWSREVNECMVKQVMHAQCTLWQQQQQQQQTLLFAVR